MTDTAYSEVAYSNDLPVAMSARLTRADVWTFHDEQWGRVQALDLELDVVSSPDARAGTAAAPIVAADVTGEGEPDFIVTMFGASATFGSVISDLDGTWSVLPFEGALGGATSSMTTNLKVQGRDLVSYENDCDPSCAEGTLYDVVWMYERASRSFTPRLTTSPDRFRGSL